MGRRLPIIWGVVLALAAPGSAEAQQPPSPQGEATQQGEQSPPSPVVQDSENEREPQESAAEQERNRRDLAAQEKMADAAFIQASDVRAQTLLLALSVVLGALASVVSMVALLVAIGTGRRELRAYVIPDFQILHISHLKPSERRAVQHDLAVTAHCKNSGQTPATDFVHWMRAEILPIESEGGLTWPESLERRSVSVISSQNAISTTYQCGRVATQQIADIQAGRAQLFCWGVISYRDIFKRIRTTKYRMKYSGMWPPPKGAVMTFCDSGNDTD